MEKEVYPQKDKYNIDDLLAIMKILRSENGCPWDKEQNHHSIRKDVLEEAYEVAEAIDSDNPDLLKEELGDLLLQVVFHAELESEISSFDFDDVCDGICKKLIYRHPHVFGNIHVNNSADVLKNWDSLKSRSKGEETASQRLESVPKLLPALMRGDKVSKRAINAGLQGMTAEIALKNIKTAVDNLEKSLLESSDSKIDKDIGMLLFEICSLSNILKKDSEESLSNSIKDFIARFKALEEEAAKTETSLDNIPSDRVIKLFEP